MTYNFDPEKWYADEAHRIELKFRSGQIDPDAYTRAMERLDEKLDEMWKRLDGTYQIRS